MTQHIAIYTRVSSMEQKNNYSLQTQLEACRKYAQSHNYAVLAEFSDIHTGTELNRPGLDGLMKLVAAGNIQVVVVYILDRLTREPSYQAILEMEMTSAGVSIEYVQDRSENPSEATLTSATKATIAQQEMLQLVERGQRGKRARAQAGCVLSIGIRAPYGYDYKSEPHKGWFIINEAEAKVVEQIYAWLLEGHTYYAIAKLLHEQRTLTRGDLYEGVYKKAGAGAWSPQTVERIVSSPTYKGIWHYGKTRREKVNGKTVQRKIPESEWITVPIPAIIDEATWTLAQAYRPQSKYNRQLNKKGLYLLQGLIFCTCGRRWTGRYKNHLKRAYYRCPSNEKERWRSQCDMPGGIRQDKLEDAVWSAVVQMLKNSDELQAQIEYRRTQSAGELDGKVKRLQAIEQVNADIARKLKILLDQMLTEGFSQSLIQERKHLLLEQQKQLQAEALRIQGELATITITPEQETQILAHAKSIAEGTTELSFEKKRELLMLLQVIIKILAQDEVQINTVLLREPTIIYVPLSPHTRKPT